MFGTIRRHQTWLWAVIITLTVISFVIYFSPYSKMNSGGGRGPANLGSINGERITEEQLANAQREMFLQYFFHNGRWPDEPTADQLRQQEAYKWLLMIQKQDQFGIHVSDGDAAETAKRLLIPFEQR